MTVSRGIRARRCNTVEERLTQNSREDENGCRVWTAGTNEAGYGVTWNGSKTVLAHRVAWEAERGPLGDSILRHACDNPPCIRLEHLLPGEHADNVRDKVSRGRQSRKLTDDQRADIRARFIPKGKGATNNGLGNISALAEEFGVSKKTIHQVVRGRGGRA